MEEVLRFINIALIIFLASCKPSSELVEGGSTSAAPRGDAPYIWSNKTFPKNLKMSENFTESELLSITSMGPLWSEAVNNETTFFTLDTLVPNKTDTSSAEELFDDELGIYKTTNWPEDFPSSALAVTQIFGRRFNVGTPLEYVGIEHADIMINFDLINGFNFDSVDNNVNEGFDLRTVVLHELGHFLGLGHVPSYTNREEAYKSMTLEQYKATSVMYPSISSSEIKRLPQERDRQDIYIKYFSTNLISAGAALKATGPKVQDPGVEARIILELHADGTCVHKENGAVLGRHFMKRK
jgi:predicted Zn-dependent protease